MSTYGKKTRIWLDIYFRTKWTSEDMQPPGPPTHVFRVNALELRVVFRRHLLREWLFEGGILSTPLFYAEFDAHAPDFLTVVVSPEYPV